MDKESFQTLLEGTGVLKYEYNCSVCGKLVTNQNKKNILRKRFETQSWKKFTMCKSCSVKEGRSKRTKEDEQKSSEKRKQTCLQKYGIENPFKDVEKIKKAYVKKLGVENPSQLQEVKEKKKETTLKHYNVENPAQSQIIKERYKQTCLNRYGVEHSFQSKECRERAKQTCLKKYGVEYHTQTESFKNYLSDIWKDVEKTKELSKKVSDTWRQKTPEELRQIRSKASKKYAYWGERFDSSWELAVWIWANDNELNIKKEPIALEYFFEKPRKYFPDFEIEGKLIEIKGAQFFKEDDTMCNPFDHDQDGLFEAKHQCGLHHGVEFWSEKEMKPILIYVKEKYGESYLDQFRRN